MGEGKIIDLTEYHQNDLDPETTFKDLLRQAKEMCVQNNLVGAKIIVSAIQFTIIHGDQAFNIIAQVQNPIQKNPFNPRLS